MRSAKRDDAHLDFHERVRRSHQPLADCRADPPHRLRPGKFLNADLDKASEDNERQHFLVESMDGVRIGFNPNCGLVARRILSFVREGDSVEAGQRVGLIRFGSRVDVYLPAGTARGFCSGQRAIAGETVLAELGVSLP
jgi:phosphatidylserine decarboxylase